MKIHRTGAGYFNDAPTGLIEHEKYGERFERAFESSLVNLIFDSISRVITHDKILNLLGNINPYSPHQSNLEVSNNKEHQKRGVFPFLLHNMLNFLDFPLRKLDNKLFEDVRGAYAAFFGSSGYSQKSIMVNYVVRMCAKYLSDWQTIQKNKVKIKSPKRVLMSTKPTYSNWKSLRDEIQPKWKENCLLNQIDNHQKGYVKILDEDRMNPNDRMLGLVKGKGFDRVGHGPLFNWAIPYLGGSNFWKFCYDGIETGWASINTWLRTGGTDFLPSGFGLAAYSLPWFDSHSRFFYEWTYPSDFLFPQFIEKEILKTYDDLYAYGMSGLAQTITKRMMRDFILMLRELYYMGKVNKYYFGPIESQFFPYAQLLFATWDILPMWRSMVPFMKDMHKKPEIVVEALEFLNKPMTDFMISIGKLTKAKSALIGNSRGSNSWISPKMFEKIYWPSMKYTITKCLDNGIVPFCHFDNNWTENMAFLADNLSKRSCVFHLDQVDLVKVHEITGDKFCLMGGMSPALLVGGSADQVEEETRHYIENIGMDGLIIASGCEIPANIPIRNLYAQKRAIMKYGFIL